MLLVLFAALCVSLTAGKVVDGEFMWMNGEEQTLQWPEKYSVKATKLSLTSNLVEDFALWKTNQSSRMDVNNGAVKFFTTRNPYSDADYYYNYIKYEVHPETDEDENVADVCTSLDSNDTYIELDDILPDVTYSSYKAIRNETIGDYVVTRFESTEKYSEIDETHILWALDEYETNTDENVWIPVRYEVKEFNSQLGSLTKHEVWEFNDFLLEFDEEVFDSESNGCGYDKVVKVTSTSDAVTKELMFVNTEKKHHVDHVFNSFKNKYNREYAHEQEHDFRRQIFKQNMRLISSTNRKNLSYKLGINHLADRTPEELKKRANLRRRPQGKSGNIPFPYTQEALKEVVDNLPDAVDLRIDGLVGPVQNQEECGSCWTYGTTAAMEGALARQNGGRLLRLSNQALIDCAWGFGAAGCNGGTDNAAYEWMMKYGLPTEEEYGSYENRDGYCHISNVTKYPIKGYTDVTPFSNAALKVALFNHGPLSVSVEVTSKFGMYSRGIFYEEDCGHDINHEVTLIGYGLQYGELFWILKNSYGVNWGMDGFMLISAKDNNCGVTTEPTYVVL